MLQINHDGGVFIPKSISVAMARTTVSARISLCTYRLNAAHTDVESVITNLRKKQQALASVEKRLWRGKSLLSMLASFVFVRRLNTVQMELEAVMRNLKEKRQTLASVEGKIAGPQKGRKLLSAVVSLICRRVS